MSNKILDIILASELQLASMESDKFTEKFVVLAKDNSKEMNNELIRVLGLINGIDEDMIININENKLTVERQKPNTLMEMSMEHGAARIKEIQNNRLPHIVRINNSNIDTGSNYTRNRENFLKGVVNKNE